MVTFWIVQLPSKLHYILYMLHWCTIVLYSVFVHHHLQRHWSWLLPPKNRALSKTEQSSHSSKYYIFTDCTTIVDVQTFDWELASSLSSLTSISSLSSLTNVTEVSIKKVHKILISLVEWLPFSGAKCECAYTITMTLYSLMVIYMIVTANQRRLWSR